MNDRTQNGNAGRKTVVAERLPTGECVELVYDRHRAQTALAILSSDGEQIQCAPSFKTPSGDLLLPLAASNNLIRHGVVLLPEEPLEYGSHEALIASIQAYISRYLDLSDAFLGIATYYVLLTWVYDAFNELPYLRFRGDFGCGKTRALAVVGAICCRPFFAAGASTVSPIFHAIDLFRGTLIFDEADFRFSDEKAELTKILNNGNVRGFPVLRTAMTPRREFDPVAFNVFGPKILAMRKAFQDPALESRCITEEMGQRRVRSDIPINLPATQEREAQELRNKLLMYRFRTLGSVAINPSLVNTHLSHRLNQILVPLLSIIPNEAVQAHLQEAAAELEGIALVERAASVEALLVEVLLEELSATTDEFIALSRLTACLVERFGSEFQRPITHRYVGSLLRQRLRIYTYKRHGVYVVPKSERSKVEVLCERYGVSVETTDQERSTDMGTRG